MQLISSSTTAQAGSTAMSTTCTATESVGDAVYVVSSGQVARAIADDSAKSEVVGFISNKPTTTTCTVITGGPAAVSGLTPTSRYYLSHTSAGDVSASAPPNGNYVVFVGIAETNASLVVEISEPELLVG